MKADNLLKVGIAVGRGTGPELADVFERVIRGLASRYSIEVKTQRSPRLYHSYFSLQEYFSNDPEDIRRITSQDVKHYLDFCSKIVATDCNVIFRTAINAQSLYLIRQHLEAVKLEHFRQGPNEMLLVRDQAQGFYTGINQHDLAEETVSRNCVFSKKVMARLLSFSITCARRHWGSNIDKVLLVYKFHLFDGVLSAWAKEWSQEYGIPINLVQPDTANRNLLVGGLQGRQLILAANEWGDIMHVILLDMFGRIAQEERCTENVYLHPAVRGLSEYQTVHGSADDIAGKDLVNPSATMRAAAAILEQKAGCVGAGESMEQALQTLESNGIGTADQKRAKCVGTQEMVDAVMDAIRASGTLSKKPKL